MSDTAVTGAAEPTPGAEVVVRGGISGSMVRVRLGVILGFVALLLAFALLAVVISGQHLWWGVPLAIVALGVSGYAAFLGIYGVIRYGLFTEGNSGSEVVGELHLSKIAWTAGIVSEIALLFTVALCIALIVRALA
jgi:hypothetical protein